jgi:hypothetical protein
MMTLLAILLTMIMPALTYWLDDMGTTLLAHAMKKQTWSKPCGQDLSPGDIHKVMSSATSKDSQTPTIDSIMSAKHEILIDGKKYCQVNMNHIV